MTDNNIVPTREELMQGVTLDYAPFYTVFKSRAHDAKVENVKFTTIKGDDDIVAKPINMQDTERAHVKAGQESKFFAKFFKGVEYTENIFNASSALPNINNKVLKALHKQFDSEVWNGTDNNGVKVSADANHIKNTSITLPKTVDGNKNIDALVALGSALKRQVEETSSSASMYMALYGSDIKNYLLKTLQDGSLYGDILRKALTGVTLMEVPANLEKVDNGIVVICPEIVELNYTLLPQVYKTGTDERKDEAWVRYLYGTAMLDVQEMGGVIVQPVTIAD